MFFLLFFLRKYILFNADFLFFLCVLFGTLWFGRGLPTNYRSLGLMEVYRGGEQRAAVGSGADGEKYYPVKTE